MSISLITHWYNEALLAPLFIKHYRSQVDRAIVIDYASTDDSMDIVRTLAPEWEIRPSIYSDFNADDLDVQVMALEAEVDAADPGGWKWVANATEFLLMPGGMRARCDAYWENFFGCVGIGSVVAVDEPSSRPRQLRTDVPMMQQIDFGYLDVNHRVRRWRFVHCHRTGRYAQGRHDTAHDHWYDHGSLVVWAGWSHIDVLKQRKLQVQTRIPETDKRLSRGWEHIMDEALLEARYREQVARSYPLVNDAVFADLTYASV